MHSKPCVAVHRMGCSPMDIDRADPIARFQVELRGILKRCMRFSRKREILVQCGEERILLRPDLPQGALERLVQGAHVPYIHVCNLGLRGESSRIRWHRLRFPLIRRLWNSYVVLVCTLLPASELKNRLYRLIGMSIGQNVEISVGAFIDPFSPQLITIGDDTVVGTFAILLTHAYRGKGRVLFGRLTIGKGCLISAMSLIGPGVIEDDATVLPGVVTLPFVQHIERRAMIGPSQQPQDIREVVGELLERLRFPKESADGD